MTDEQGKPNIGPYPCGGILIIDPHTQEIIRSGQYWAMAHFSRRFGEARGGLSRRAWRPILVTCCG